MSVIISKRMPVSPVEIHNKLPSVVRIDFYPTSKILSIAFDNVTIKDLVRLVGQAISLAMMAVISQTLCTICKYRSTDDLANNVTPVDWEDFDNQVEVLSNAR